MNKYKVCTSTGHNVKMIVAENHEEAARAYAYKMGASWNAIMYCAVVRVSDGLTPERVFDVRISAEAL